MSGHRLRSRCSLHLALFLVVLLATLAISPAQTPVPAPTQLTFDVVSVHRMRPEDTRPEHIENPTKRAYLQATNVTLKSLMEVAYDIPDLRMFGGPAWLPTERFSLEAKSDPAADAQLAALPPEQARALKRKMVEALLKQTFRLVVHPASRDLPVYLMTVARGGPRLVKTPTDRVPAGDELITIGAGSDSLQILAYELSWRLGRPVLDKTGLQYRETLTLRWRDERGSSADTEAPSVFTAMQEQLGLRLDTAKSPVAVLIIDHAEQPAEP